MKKYAIISRGDKESSDLVKELRNGLDGSLKYNEKAPDLVISVGGDGTMLYSVHAYQHLLEKTAFVGIHTGTLGFYTDYQKDEAHLLIYDIKHSSMETEARSLIEIDYQDRTYFALNEMRLENNRHSQVIDIHINNEYLETFRGNGICISTPSGSTAYNKAVQGAVVSQGIRVMQISEIAGINHNAYRSLGSSLILTDQQEVTLHTINYEHTVLCIDIDCIELAQNETIKVRVSQKEAHFASFRQVSFVERLKKAFL
ncbi:NAD kinase [Eggerthia catenaformis]|uniref:NAD kinase n=1 Tax=Eggerthia catenaformis TaxID=31973 RepID=UPI00248E39BD|nr:NAD kinase [Eggerthia catenaformis]